MRKIFFMFFVFAFIVTIQAQNAQVIYMSPDGTGDGSNPFVPASDISAAAPLDSNIVIRMRSGVYTKPIKIHYSDITTRIVSLQIKGGYSPNNILYLDSYLDLSNPEHRTIIVGDGSGSAIELNGKLLNNAKIENVTISNSINGAAIKYVGEGNLIISKCRFENNIGPSSYLIDKESPAGSCTALFNSVISDNDVHGIYHGYCGCKFINTTIVNNNNYFLVNTGAKSHDTYEIRNSIIQNTGTHVFSDVYDNVDVSYSIVDDLSYLNNVGNNNNVYIDFSGDSNDPYSCPDCADILFNGDFSIYNQYMQLQWIDNKDIIGNDRIVNNQIDIGAYQNASTSYTRTKAHIKPMKIKDSETVDFSCGINIYPTNLQSGGLLYFERITEAELTAHVYSIGGIEVYTVPLKSQTEEILMECPIGVYIVIVTDDVTGKRLYQTKIIVN